MIYALLLALLATFTSAQHTPSDGLIHKAGYCVTYGKCTDQGLPCVNNTVAPPRDQSTAFSADLLKTCPHLATETNLCCDSNQLEFLMSSAAVAGMESIVAGCPSCLTNLRALFCDLACSPDQSLFTEVVESLSGAVPTYVTKFNHYLSNHFAKTVHKSCVNVSTLICMNFWDKCSLSELYGYLGDNYYTVLKTDYVIGDDDVSPLVRAKSDYMKIPCGEQAPAANCSSPVVRNGTVAPETDIASGSSYTVTCTVPYIAHGEPTVLCTDGVLSALPSCALPTPPSFLLTSSVEGLHTPELAVDNDLTTYAAVSAHGSGPWYKVYLPYTATVQSVTFTAYCTTVRDVFTVSMMQGDQQSQCGQYQCTQLGEVTLTVACGITGKRIPLTGNVIKLELNNRQAPLILFNIEWAG